MDAKFLKVVMLAAVADGEIQGEELEMLNQIKKSHPELKNIPMMQQELLWLTFTTSFQLVWRQNIYWSSYAANLIKRKGRQLFALAKEVCAADFNILPAETEFLQLVIEMCQYLMT